MLHSMTGYGKSSGFFEGKKISVEIKALNSKGMDLYLRIANPYREKELDFRNYISNALDRGKVEANIQLENVGEIQSMEINKVLAKAYYNDLVETNKLIDGKIEDYLPLLLKMPDIFIQSKDSISEEEFLFVNKIIAEACQNLNSFRRQEGIALENEFTKRIEEIRSLLNLIPNFENERIENIKEKFQKSLEELGNAGYDEFRFQQEIIYYLEKYDVSEEKMRLSNHLDYFLETIHAPQSGKKLGFITQEIGREINTLGSKSYHIEMQKLVVDMKDSLEKIKEQVLNTL
jgi:uncharacterized protein (TIGR00255 family)